MRACERCSCLTLPAHHAHLLSFCSTPAAPADLLHECYRGSGQARCRCNDAPTRPGGCKGKSARRDSEQAETVVLSPTFPYHGLSPPSLAAGGQSHLLLLPLRRRDTGGAGAWRRHIRRCATSCSPRPCRLRRSAAYTVTLPRARRGLRVWICAHLDGSGSREGAGESRATAAGGSGANTAHNERKLTGPHCTAISSARDRWLTRNRPR